MQYISTSGNAPSADFETAILRGLAPDGGLYVPEHFPVFSESEQQALRGLSWSQLGARVLMPFVGALQSKLPELCERAFDFPVPLRELERTTWLLELFHGPSLAFKDVGARFLAECIGALPLSGTHTILVATSGDTGGAVAAAFFGKPNIRVKIYYPRGRISHRQELQLTRWGNNVQAVALDGDFDACQARVKRELNQDPEKTHFLSANSINLGRLLPQTVYYAWASLQFSSPISFVIPSGNLGNATAAFWARAMGFPIHSIVLATNVNETLPQYYLSGQYTPLPTRQSLANAMDVGDPSNFARLQHLFPTVEKLRAVSCAFSINDEEITETIRRAYQQWQVAICPHTATGLAARTRCPASERFVVVATAHPAKFETIVEPLIGRSLPVPAALFPIG